MPRGERLACAQIARTLASRLTALSAVLLAQADATRESLQQAGAPTTSWLTLQAGLSKREAAGLLHQARELAEHPEVAQAAAAGRISVNQAKAIGSVLGGLNELDDTQQAQAEQLLLAMAGNMDSDRLAKATPLVLAHVAPQVADETLERRLQRQAEAAQRNRSLVFRRDGNGSILFTGSLPLVDGEAWIAQLDAYTESQEPSHPDDATHNEHRYATPDTTPGRTPAGFLRQVPGWMSTNRPADAGWATPPADVG